MKLEVITFYNLLKVKIYKQKLENQDQNQEKADQVQGDHLRDQNQKNKPKNQENHQRIRKLQKLKL